MYNCKHLLQGYLGLRLMCTAYLATRGLAVNLRALRDLRKVLNAQVRLQDHASLLGPLQKYESPNHMWKQWSRLPKSQPRVMM